MNNNIYRLNFMYYEKNNKIVEKGVKYSFDCFTISFNEEDSFKILSYLYDLISKEEKQKNSYKILNSLNDLLDNKVLGFVKIKTIEKEVKELFDVVEVFNQYIIFNKKIILNNNSSWYIPNITYDDIVDIYNKYNINFDKEIVNKKLKKKNKIGIL